MAKEPKKLDDLFHDTLKDIYFAERKILTALPKMAKAAQSQDLRTAFEKHHTETEGQVERLEQVFELLGKKAQGKTCDAIMGLVEEGQEIMKEYKGSPAIDAGKTRTWTHNTCLPGGARVGSIAVGCPTTSTGSAGRRPAAASAKTRLIIARSGAT